jgi:diguanylate cyclase (GGDEF)-like protein/PAS domain S-box-containing protein
VEQQQVDLGVLRQAAAVSARMNHGQQLQETLQAVADGAVETLRFGAAAVNYLLPDGNLQVLAVAGPDELKDVLAGQIVEHRAMKQVLDGSERWGTLRFVSQNMVCQHGMPEWLSTVTPPVDEPRHPGGGLLALLHGSKGTMLGVLSVGLPRGHRRPGTTLREMLEIYAVQAGLAIDRVRLIEELRHEHARLQASESAFRFSFTASTAPMATVSLEGADHGRFLQVNDALCRVLGWSRAELQSRRWQQLIPPEDVAEVEGRLADLAAGRRQEVEAERLLARGDGTKIWAHGKATVVRADPAPFLLIHVEDITERKAREAELERLARVDPLTGLANRAAVLGHLRALASNRRHMGAVLFCDLDGFKAVNDDHGHLAGDRVLKDVAARLRDEVGDEGVVGRLGGDEFIVIADGLDSSRACRLAERLRAAFRRPFSDLAATINISVGVASLSEAGWDTDRILNQADAAMYADKRNRGR